MAKLRDNAITKLDITDYLNQYSDFSFEVVVLKKLISLGFDCEHAGTYEDPITKKTREFDIRAKKTIINEQKFQLNISLSVECKNLKSNFPLIVHCMPREKQECYLDLIWASKPQSYIGQYENAMRIPLEENDSPYKLLDAVGKSCDQVGRKDSHLGEVIGNDGDVFDKISQAINAAHDLVKDAHYDAENGLDVITLVIPVLVVPNEKIWSVWYTQTGEIEREPTLEKNIEYYLNKGWLIGNPMHEYQRRYYLSHLEIVQVGYLSEMVEKYITMPILNSLDELMTKKLQVIQNRSK